MLDFDKENFEHSSMVVGILNLQQTETLAKEHPLIPLLFENGCSLTPVFQQFNPIDFTNEANFNWAARQLLDVLNIPRPQFSPKSPDNLPNYGVDDLHERSKGETFVDAVAKLYRLRHYEVQSPVQWEGVTFDLSVAKSDFGMRYQALVTCLDSYCSTEHVNQIAAKHHQVQNLLSICYALAKSSYYLMVLMKWQIASAAIRSWILTKSPLR
jgi:hypothetical protein